MTHPLGPPTCHDWSLQAYKGQISNPNSGQLCRAKPALEIPKGFREKSHRTLRLLLELHHSLTSPSPQSYSLFSPKTMALCQSLLLEDPDLWYGYLNDNVFMNWNQMHSSLLAVFTFPFNMTDNFEPWARWSLPCRTCFLKWQGNIGEPGKKYVTLLNTNNFPVLNTI